MGIKQEEFERIVKQVADMSNDQLAALSFETFVLQSERQSG